MAFWVMWTEESVATLHRGPCYACRDGEGPEPPRPTWKQPPHLRKPAEADTRAWLFQQFDTLAAEVQWVQDRWDEPKLHHCLEPQPRYAGEPISWAECFRDDL